jgi:amino acid permease
MYKNILLPASMLAGTIIGAGIFSLPFVFQKSGLLAGLLLLLIFAFIYALVYFIYADIVLRTEGEHRFVGYAKMYLGNPGFLAAVFLGLVQLFFILTVYLILAPSFTGLIFGGSYLSHFLFFWFISSLIVLLNTKRIAGLEFLIVLGMSLIILLIFFSGIGKIDPVYLYDFNFSLNSLAVVGPALFALAGIMAVPEIVAYFRESVSPLKFLKRSLLLGSFLPVLAYTAFILGIIGLSKNVSEDAVSGLIGNAPVWLILSLGVLGFLALTSAYALIGLNIKHTLEYDFSLPRWLSKILVVFVPPVLYFLGFNGFVGTVSLIGSVFIPLEIILLIFIWRRVDKIKPTDDFFNRNFTKISLPFLLAIFLIVLFCVIIRVI